MTRGTTPTIILNLIGADLTSSKVYVTFLQNTGINRVLLSKSNADISMTYDNDTETTTIEVYLTQAETLAFTDPEYVQLQVRWVTSLEEAYASPIKTVETKKILKEGVISYA